MFHQLLKFITEHSGTPTKDIIHSDEWDSFDFRLEDRKFDKEIGCTKKTKLSGETDHQTVGKKINPCQDVC